MHRCIHNLIRVSLDPVSTKMKFSTLAIVGAVFASSANAFSTPGFGVRQVRTSIDPGDNAIVRAGLGHDGMFCWACPLSSPHCLPCGDLATSEKLDLRLTIAFFPCFIAIRLNDF